MPAVRLWRQSFGWAEQLFAAGGPVLVVIVALSVLALAVILRKAAQFGRAGLGRRNGLDAALAAWGAGEPDRALCLLARVRGPIARALEAAARGKLDGALDRRGLEEEAARDGAARLVSLRSHLRLLELIAMICPLLGLLGTVLGMIDAFQALEAAGRRVDPAVLSGGIWTALLTTAAGLVVAIPAAAAHHLFEGVVERTAHSMEDALTRILAGPVPAAPQRGAPPVLRPAEAGGTSSAGG